MKPENQISYILLVVRFARSGLGTDGCTSADTVCNNTSQNIGHDPRYAGIVNLSLFGLVFVFEVPVGVKNLGVEYRCLVDSFIREYSISGGFFQRGESLRETAQRNCRRVGICLIVQRCDTGFFIMSSEYCAPSFISICLYIL